MASRTRSSQFRLSAIAAAVVSASLAVPSFAAPFTSSNRDVLTSNTGVWNPAGVLIGGTRFVVKGLEGVGRVSAASTQSFGPLTETLGSISDLQISNWRRTAAGDGYTGTFNALPDRGFNSGATFSNYAARINTFDFSFTPYTAAAPTANQNQIALTYTGSTRFTYDHDGNAATAPVLTTGLLANSAAVSLFGKPVPTVVANTTVGSDGPLANRLTLDSEGLILDPRPGKEGEGWVGDEYGAFIYHFDANKQIDGMVSIPDALIPHRPAGTTYFTDSPANVDGRRVNQGMEGITITPDGKHLIAMLQSATLQDSGSGNQGRTNTRVLVYDIAGGVEVPTDPVAQYVLQLPRIDGDLNGSVDRAGAQSAILALNSHQILILSRDGNGRGAGTPSPVFKSVLLADFDTATNIDGLYDAAGNKVVSSGDTLLGSITPVVWTEALNILGKLDLGITELEQFGLNLAANNGDINTLSEKWEGMDLVSALDPLHPNDYFLFLGNDNDFQTSTGTLTRADGTSLNYDAGLENDTMLLAFRVSVVPEPGALALLTLASLPMVGLQRRRRRS